MSDTISSPGVVLTIQSKHRTFTPAQFIAAFRGREFVETQVTAQISANPHAPPMQTTMYSKDDLLVFFNDSENLVRFHILNTLDAAKYRKEVQSILASLNFGRSSTASMMVACTATIVGQLSPTQCLTTLIDSKAIGALQEIHGHEEIAVTSVRFSQYTDPNESLTVSIEPLLSDPTGTYFVAVEQVTTSLEKFNEFLDKIGGGMIQKIVEGVEKRG